MSRLKEIIDTVMSIDPDANALEFDGQWRSWKTLTSIMRAVEDLLDANDIKLGTRIGGVLRNKPEIAAVILGTISRGRCLVTLNPALPEDKLAADIEKLRTPVVFALSEDWARDAVMTAARKTGALGIEITGKEHEPARVILPMSGSDFDYDADGVGIEMLTSGTTGTPKRVPLKSANFEKMILDAAVFEKNRDVNAPPKLSEGVAVLNTPFAHIGGIFGLFVNVSAGRKACMLERFRVDDFVDAVKRHRPRVLRPPDFLF